MSESCPHITEPWLREFYAANPRLHPACCWFATDRESTSAPATSSRPIRSRRADKPGLRLWREVGNISVAPAPGGE